MYKQRELNSQAVQFHRTQGEQQCFKMRRKATRESNNVTKTLFSQAVEILQKLQQKFYNNLSK